MPGIAYRKLSDLPETLPVFPLGAALLFPRWNLPLNIFEPRYLNMVDDAMATHRLIGMIQPAGGPSDKPNLAKVGCAGRITSYTETADGRYLITLTGIARYGVTEEISMEKPYRRVTPDWSPYLQDLAEPDMRDLPNRDVVLTALRKYVEANQMKADWEAVEDAQIETLVNALCAGCPFEPREKQALVEAPTLKARADTLIKLLNMDVPGAGGTMQ